MRKLIALFVCLLFATSLIAAAGCAKKEEPAKPAVQPAKPAEPAKAAEPEKKAEEAKPAEKAPEKAPEKK
jgi:flagellar basal body L-ring protein FlgH